MWKGPVLTSFDTSFDREGPQRKKAQVAAGCVKNAKKRESHTCCQTGVRPVRAPSRNFSRDRKCQISAPSYFNLMLIGPMDQKKRNET